LGLFFYFFGDLALGTPLGILNETTTEYILDAQRFFTSSHYEHMNLFRTDKAVYSDRSIKLACERDLVG